jgi:transcriptional regulator with XRE-family HTH domain
MTAPEPKLAEFGAVMRAARLALDLTRRQLGTAISVGQATISNFERGRMRPSRRRFAQLKQLLQDGCS